MCPASLGEPRTLRLAVAWCMTVDPISVSLSLASFVLAATTAWLTLLRPGTLKMVRPSLVAFLDQAGVDGPKIWFRSLIYSTSRRGNVLESMFVRVRRGETQQNFSFWVCGERGELASGCGLYVEHTGIALNHHFVLPKDGSRFDFVPGDYVIEVFASLVNSRSPLLLARIALHLTEEHAKALKNPNENVYFDWWPDSGRYNAHVVRRRPPPNELPDALAELFEQKAGRPFEQGVSAGKLDQ